MAFLPPAGPRQAAAGIAALGRQGDSTVAHLTPGEMVLPKSAQTPGIMALVASTLRSKGMNPAKYMVGSAHNSINPMTGVPEYFDSFDMGGGSTISVDDAGNVTIDGFSVGEVGDANFDVPGGLNTQGGNALYDPIDVYSDEAAGRTQIEDYSGMYSAGNTINAPQPSSVGYSGSNLGGPMSFSYGGDSLTGFNAMEAALGGPTAGGPAPSVYGEGDFQGNPYDYGGRNSLPPAAEAALSLALAGQTGTGRAPGAPVTAWDAPDFLDTMKGLEEEAAQKSGKGNGLTGFLANLLGDYNVVYDESGNGSVQWSPDLAGLGISLLGGAAGIGVLPTFAAKAAYKSFTRDDEAPTYGFKTAGGSRGIFGLPRGDSSGDFPGTEVSTPGPLERGERAGPDSSGAEPSRAKIDTLLEDRYNARRGRRVAPLPQSAYTNYGIFGPEAQFFLENSTDYGYFN